MQNAKTLVIKAIETHRASRREDDRHVATFFLPMDYQNLMFVAAEIDERTSGFEFDDERNPRTETLALLQRLEKWGAIKELHEYAWVNKSPRGAWNLASLFGLRAHNPATIRAGDEQATEEALLLGLRIQEPGPGEDLHVPEMEKGSRDVPYLREAYDRALKRYRAEKEAKEEGVMEEKSAGKVVHAIYAILAPVAVAAITILMFISELPAKLPLRGRREGPRARAIGLWDRGPRLGGMHLCLRHVLKAVFTGNSV
jgi:hypothetical protein